MMSRMNFVIAVSFVVTVQRQWARAQPATPAAPALPKAWYGGNRQVAPVSYRNRSTHLRAPSQLKPSMTTLTSSSNGKKVPSTPS
jgi:hypothetical protein